LREQLGDLYGKVNGYDGRPTNGQIALAGVLEDELKKGEAAFAALLAKETPALNSGLSAKKQPALARESREAWDKRSEDAAGGSAKPEMLMKALGFAPSDEAGERD
jgi:hypothetical protein